MGESLGFLIPVKYGKLLLNNWLKQPIIPSSTKDEVISQLKAHSKSLAQSILQKPWLTTQVDHFSQPNAIDTYISCWGSDEKNTKLFYSYTDYVCQGNTKIFAGYDTTIGGITYADRQFQAGKLNAFQFGKVISWPPENKDSSQFNSMSEFFGKFTCLDHIVKYQGMKAKTVLCSRPYLKFDGIWDFQLKVTSLKSDKEAFRYILNLNGIEKNDGIAIIKHYMEAIQWHD